VDGSLKQKNVIWMYWHSGLASAPPLVRICIESWQRRNPDWTVRVLDDASLTTWVDMQDVREQNPLISTQAFSDVLRWRLLARHGGVWADATLYCSRPLDDWLTNELSSSPIFLFRSGEVDLIHSWFIAVRNKSVLIPAMADQMTHFTCRFGGFQHYFDLRGLWRLYHLIERKAGRGNYFIWRSWLFRRLLKAAPYFFQNYLLGYLISISPECRNEFDRIRIPYGDVPHDIQKITQNGQPPTAKSLQLLLAQDCPVQKLTLKRYAWEWSTGGTLDFLDQYGR